MILKSDLHDCVPVGIGKGLKIKINANIGTSGYNNDPAMELEKLAASVRYGADTVMDLSTGGDIRAMRRMIIRESRVPDRHGPGVRGDRALPGRGQPHRG